VGCPNHGYRIGDGASGIAGSWLDSWIGVNFLTLVGFVAGFVALLAIG